MIKKEEFISNISKPPREALDRAIQAEKKLTQIEEVLKNRGIGQGADLEAFYKIEKIIRSKQMNTSIVFNEDDHKRSGFGIEDLIKMNKPKGVE